MLLFSNNAEATLAAALPGSYSDTEITVTESGQAAGFATPASGQWQLATLTDSSLPGVFEVVRITERTGPVFVVERGHELPNGVSSLPSWPAGAKLSARVTAKTLEAFAQVGAMEPSVTAADTDTGTFAFTSLPVLRQLRAQPTNGFAPSSVDRSFAAEVSGWSQPVDLGVPITWNSSPHGISDVVVPTVPNGNQYWFDPSDYSAHTQAYTDVEPDFNNTEFLPVVAYTGTSPDVQAAGFWVPTEMPVALSIFFGSYKLIVSEVGFVVFDKTSTTNPVVNFGEQGNSARFASAVELNQVTASQGMHRIPVVAGGGFTNSLRFEVVTAAAGGSFRGRFYWRGFLMDTYE